MRDNRLCANDLFERFYLGVENFDGCGSDFVAAVLCEEDLLRGKVEVFVCDDLVPALVRVEGDAVHGYAFMICGAEDVFCIRGVDKSNCQHPLVEWRGCEGTWSEAGRLFG